MSMLFEGTKTNKSTSLVLSYIFKVIIKYITVQTVNLENLMTVLMDSNNKALQ